MIEAFFSQFNNRQIQAPKPMDERQYRRSLITLEVNLNTLHNKVNGTQDVSPIIVDISPQFFNTLQVSRELKDILSLQSLNESDSQTGARMMIKTMGGDNPQLDISFANGLQEFRHISVSTNSTQKEVSINAHVNGQLLEVAEDRTNYSKRQAKREKARVMQLAHEVVDFADTQINLLTVLAQSRVTPDIAHAELTTHEY